MSEQNRGRIVAGIGVPHTPGLGNQIGRADPAQLKRIMEGFDKVRQDLADARPDVMIAFVNDHFDMFTLRNMPGFAIALGDTHWGPPSDAEASVNMKRAPIPGNSELAREICAFATKTGFELHRIDSAEFIHNILLPKKFIWPDLDIPVVPIFINCFAPPLPTFRRSYELGCAIREIVKGRPERIAVLASGGLSHWPPIIPDEEGDEGYNARITELNNFGRRVASKDGPIRMVIMKREIEMAESGRTLINVDWDTEIMKRLADGDAEYLVRLDHEDVHRAAGPGGSEMMMWVALMGVMNDRKGKIVMYEPVKEWMGGVGLLTYFDDSSAGSAANKAAA